MPINKITPRSLDKSTDQRLVPATAFIDAVNAVIEDSGLNGDGNDGVIKNANSNEQVVTHTALDAVGTTEDDVKIIGSVVDHKLKLVYLFVKNSNPQENGVWVYDPYGKLSLPTKYAWEFLENESGDQGAYQDGFDGYDAYAKNTLKCVAKGAYFDFDEHSVVQGNVVYGNTLTVPKGLELLTVTSAERNTFEKDFHLYFTDNRTEPKKINVIGSMFSRAISLKMGDENPYGIFDSLEGGRFKLPDGKNEEILFSYACRPTPLKRPTFRFQEDPLSNANNFEKSEGFQFAYQIVYNDGSESAISPKSELAYMPSLLYQGKNKNIDHSPHNSCKIDINDDFITFSDGQANYIKKIKVLAQEGSGPYNIIEEINSPSSPISFDFKNDVVGIIVPSKEENKFFDSVPQKAEAQTVVDNRLMYGNYVDGYKNTDVQASLSVIYQERPAETFGQALNINASVMLDLDPSSNDDGDVKQKMSGVRIEIGDDQFPELSSGDIITMSMSFLPAKNFHIYNATKSFHQSRHLGIENSDEENEYWQTPTEAGAKNIAPNAANNITLISTDQTTLTNFNAFKANGGVLRTNWTVVDDYQDSLGSTELVWGTSAANPLIIPSASISFSISLRCNVSGVSSNALRSWFFEITDRVLAGAGSPGYDSSPNAVFSLESVDNYFTSEWNLPIQNFTRFEDGSDLSKLINMGAKNVSNSVSLLNGGCMILKKGSARFGLKKTNLSTESSAELADINNSQLGGTQKYREYKIILDAILLDGLEMWTCVRKWMPGSPWWAISPDFMLDVQNGDASMNDFYEGTEYTLPEYAGAYEPEENFTTTAGVVRGAFEQKNDVTDFNFPGGQLSDSGYNLLNGDFRYVDESLKSIIGYVKLAVDNVFDAGYLVASPSPREFRPFNATINSDYAKFYSMFDGEGGPGGSLPPHSLPEDYDYPDWAEGENPIYRSLNYASSAHGISARKVHGPEATPAGFDSPKAIGFFGPYFTGKILSFSSFIDNNPDYQYKSYFQPDGNKAGNPPVNTYRFQATSTVPLIQGTKYGIVFNGSSVGPREKLFSIPYDDFSYPPDTSGWDGVENMTMSFSLFNPQIERFSSTYFDIQPAPDSPTISLLAARSFKASSDHSFGVVFYDAVGRRSFVNDIGSVYVQGYSDAERGSNKGASRIKVNLSGTPPEFASKYQIVYGGNKTASDFIQYTTNNAYYEITSNSPDDLEFDQENGKIYLSLNLLQNSSISYAKEFGARGTDGGLSIYKYSEGDKVRIISYGIDSNREYPKNVVFDIIEVVHFDELSSLESNPLIDANLNPGLELFGEFLVLRNNEQSSHQGFRYSDLLSGASVWDRNVVFEVFSPKKSTGVEAQVYREIGEVYDVDIDQSGSLSYSVPEIILYEGDIYFRPKACNVNKQIDGGWEDLMSVDQDATDNSTDLKSNFANIYTENKTASDLVRSEVNDFGRVNVSSPNANKVRREAGIIYSEKSNPESDKLNYSSFNASLFPYKDLEERFGNINFMDEVGGNLFVIQQDRCTKIPVSATMLTNASGQEQLIASNEILGKEAVASIKAGCDNNPESVVRVDNTFYFAHKSTGKVFRFVDGQGIEEISDVNMASYFREIFDEAIAMSQRPDLSDVRVVGGYEPIKQEYLLTILTPEE